jgi:hypothetical protein
VCTGEAWPQKQQVDVHRGQRDRLQLQWVVRSQECRKRAGILCAHIGEHNRQKFERARIAAHSGKALSDDQATCDGGDYLHVTATVAGAQLLQRWL